MTTPTQGEHAQPEALRLADALASNYFDGKQGRDVWDAAAAELRRLHAQVAAQPAAPQGGAYVENPVEIEHVAGDVSKNRAESNMTGGAYAELADKLESGAVAVGSDGEWVSIRRHVRDEAVQALRASHGQAPAAHAPWKDHQTAKLVNDLRDCAKEYHGTQQLRDRLLHILGPMIDWVRAAQAPAAGAVAGPTVRKVFLVATGEVHEGEATYTRYDDAPPPLCDSECLYTTAPTPAAQGDALADSQYLAGVTAGWNAAQSSDPNAALQKLHESRAGYLEPLRDARAALAQKEGK